MKLELTKEQYRNLLIAVVIGTYVRSAVDDSNGKDFRKAEEIEDYLLAVAKDFESEDLTQNFEGHLMISDDLIEEYHENYIEEYEQDFFWHELTTRLGQRDFAENSTKEERELVDKNSGWLGVVIDKYYEKYEEEFETRGIERLKIDVADKKVEQFINELKY